MSKKLTFQFSGILGKQTWGLKSSLTSRSQGKFELSPRKHRGAAGGAGVSRTLGVN